MSRHARSTPQRLRTSTTESAQKGDFGAAKLCNGPCVPPGLGTRRRAACGFFAENRHTPSERTLWCAVNRRLPLAVKQLAPDQHAADFIRAGADLVEFRVTQNAAGRVLVDVAVAAQALDCFECNLHGAGGSMQQAGGRIDA